MYAKALTEISLLFAIPFLDQTSSGRLRTSETVDCLTAEKSLSNFGKEWELNAASFTYAS